MKRLVAQAGDTIEMRTGVLIRNGGRLTEPYATRDSVRGGVHYPEMLWQRAIVTIRDTAVTHVPVWIYFSRDTASGIRWSRVGGIPSARPRTLVNRVP